MNDNHSLTLELLKQEYEIVLKQYQESMNTYIENLYKNEKNNKCSKYKNDDTNISQSCHDIIWNKQGCTTNAPSVDTTKTLNKLIHDVHTISTSSDETNLTQCYGNSDVNNLIKNNLFDNLKLENNTFKYISGNSVPNWTFNSAALINNSESL